MWPLSAFSIIGRKARVQRYTPPQQMLNVRSHSSRSATTKLEPPPMPTLLNSRWTLSVSCCLATSPWKRSTAALSETSRRCVVIRRPCGRRSCRQSRSVSARPLAETSHIAMLTPSATSWRTSSRPMPEPPPVTTAIRPARSFITYPWLERPDLHLAELQVARAVLQRDVSRGRQPVVCDVDRLLAVQDDHEVVALRGDLVGVPLARGLGHRNDGGNVDDRAGAVLRIGALVEDVDLVADRRVDLRGVLAADEDAAVHVLVDPELGVDLEVLVLVLGDEIGGILALELVGHDRAALDPPVGGAHAGEVTHALAVHDGGPSRILRIRHTTHQRDARNNGNDTLSHDVSPSWLTLHLLQKV